MIVESLCFFLLQISHFNTEMAKLCDNVKTMQSNCRLTDDNKDLASLRKRTEDVASKLSEIKSATKVCHYTPVIHHHLQKWFFVMCTRYKWNNQTFVRLSSATDYDYVVHCEGFWSMPSSACALPNNYSMGAYIFTSCRGLLVGEGLGQVGEFSKNVRMHFFLPFER